MSVTFAGDILFDPGYAVMSKLQAERRADLGRHRAGPDRGDEKRGHHGNSTMNFPTRTEERLRRRSSLPSAPGRKTVSYLGDLGVDLVSLANNHAYDYGETAFLDTMDTLAQAGITYMGAGRNLQEARRPVYYIINNMKMLLWLLPRSSGWTIRIRRARRILPPVYFAAGTATIFWRRCGEARQNSDFVIVFLHWGTENQEYHRMGAGEAGAGGGGGGRGSDHRRAPHLPAADQYGKRGAG